MSAQRGMKLFRWSAACHELTLHALSFLIFAFLLITPLQVLAEECNPPSGYLALKTLQDLQAVKNAPQLNYFLCNDIDLSAYIFDGSVISAHTYKFGIFEGNNKTISGLTIDSSALGPHGLFGHWGGRIRNLKVENVSINATRIQSRVGAYVGGLVGKFEDDGIITNCTVSGVVAGIDGVGGMVGWNKGVIDGVSANVHVRSSGPAGQGGVEMGGLVGYNQGHILNSTAIGDVHGRQRVGGLVGHDAGLIYNSTAHGDVVGNADLGGLVGFQDLSGPGTISASAAHGSISPSNEYGFVGSAGGLVGRSMHGKITDSFATGTIFDGRGYIGGLIGDAFDVTIHNCFSSGVVNGQVSTGGLVGSALDSSISDSYSSSPVVGDSRHSFGIGGLIGRANSLQLTRSYALGDVSLVVPALPLHTQNPSNPETCFFIESVGGLVGGLLSGQISESFARGAIEGPGLNLGGIVGQYDCGFGGSKIERTYFAGTLHPRGPVNLKTGGIVGSCLQQIKNPVTQACERNPNSPPVVLSSHWDQSLFAYDNGIGEGRLTSELTRVPRPQNTYVGWNFEQTWNQFDTRYPNLRRALVVSGQVMQNNGYKGLGNVTLNLDGSGVAALTDSHGIFRFSTAPIGLRDLVPSLLGYEFSPDRRLVTIENSSIHGIRFDATNNPPIHELRVRVKESIGGAVVPDAHVYLYAGILAAPIFGPLLQDQVTNIEGQARLSALQNSSYTLFVSKLGFLRSSEITAINGTDSEIEVLLDRDPSPRPLSGWVLVGDGNNEPLNETRVTIYPQAIAPMQLVTMTNQVGFYSAASMPSAETIKIVPMREGLLFEPPERILPPGGAPLTQVNFRAYPEVPRSVRASQGVFTDRVVVTWQNSYPSLLYYIYRTEGVMPPNQCSGTPLSIVEGTDTFEDFSATPNVRYSYGVRSATEGGTTSACDVFYGAYRREGGTNRSPPLNVQATDGTSLFVTLSWDHVPGETYYEIFSETSPIACTGEKRISPSSPALYTTIPIGQDRFFSVRGCNLSASPRCGPCSVSDRGFAATLAPAIESVVAEGPALKVNIRYQEGALVNFDLYRSTIDQACTGEPLARYIPIGSGAITTFADSSVEPGIQYYYSAKARGQNGREGGCSVTKAGSLPPQRSSSSASSSSESSKSSISSSTSSSSSFRSSEPSSSSNSSLSSSSTSSASSVSSSSSSSQSSSSSSSISSSSFSSSSSLGGGESCSEEANEDCINERLGSSACVGTNSFLRHINIVSILNRQAVPLNMVLQYRDLSGVVRSQVAKRIEPNLKGDFIVNDMAGYLPDSYGTVCAVTDAATIGAWSGNIVIYKADTRINPNPIFGSGFDYALSYPFTNPRSGVYTLPLNTFRLGMPEKDLVANWIALTDSDPDDGANLRGTLVFFDENGAVVDSTEVDVVNGGRVDYPGHVGVGGRDVRQAVGMVRFIPEDLQRSTYYITLTRYYYDGASVGLPNIRTASVIPNRPATLLSVSGGASTKDGLISIVELINIGDSEAQAQLRVFAGSGNSLGEESYVIPPRGTRHLILNRSGQRGFLADDVNASAQVRVGGGQISARSLFYRLSVSNELLYAFAAPMYQSSQPVQLSQYNSFIDQQNIVEVVNTGASELSLAINALKYSGGLAFSANRALAPFATERVPLTVSPDEYGTVIIQASRPGYVHRVLTRRGEDYTIADRGE